jgi:hypothetical protein
MFFTPLTIEYNSYKVFTFFLLVAWLIPIELAFLYLLDNLIQRLSKAEYSEKNFLFMWCILFSFMCLVWIVYLIGFNPANMTIDSIDQWSQATDISKLDDWHPVFHTLFIKGILSFVKSPSAVAIVQIIFLSAVISSLLTWLFKNGIPLIFIIIFTVLFSIAPNNGIYINTLWKDIPFSISLLWLTFLSMKFVVNKPYFSKSICNLAQLVICLIFIYFFRHNGFVTFFVVIGLLSFYSFKKRDKNLGLSITITVILVMSIKFILLNNLDIKKNPAGIKYLSMTHGIALAYINGEKISYSAKTFFDKVMPFDEWKKYYYAYSINPYMFDNSYHLIDKLSELKSKDIIFMYLYSLKESPFLLIKDRLNGTDLIWNITEPKGGYNFRYNDYFEQNTLGLQRNENNITKLLIAYGKTSYKSKLLDIIFWRAGIYYAIIILIMFYWFIKKSYNNFYILLPLGTNTFSLILSVGWQDYRYVYFVWLIFWFVLMFSLTKNQIEQKKIPSNF